MKENSDNYTTLDWTSILGVFCFVLGKQTTTLKKRSSVGVEMGKWWGRKESFLLKMKFIFLLKMKFKRKRGELLVR